MLRHLHAAVSGGLPKQWRLHLTVVGVLATLLVVFATPIWTYLMLAIAGGAFAFLLQQAPNPTPLFWTVPAEAWTLIWSSTARVNHIWLHRTQSLIRESHSPSARIDGFATPSGFVLVGSGLDEVGVQCESELAWRMMELGSPGKKETSGCRTLRFVLALWLVAGGLLVIGIWRGIDVASTILLVVFCSAAGHGLAGPVERLMRSRVERCVSGSPDAERHRIEVASVDIRHFIWMRGVWAFQVRRIGWQSTTANASR